MPQAISATEARESFSEIINRVLYSGEEFIVERQGKPTALITRPENVDSKKALAQKMRGVNFLLKLARYNFKGGPKDLAQKHDKYTWE